MLRPVVAATNFAKAGKKTGFDIGTGVPVAQARPAITGVTGFIKVPAWRKTVNELRKGLLSRGPEPFGPEREQRQHPWSVRKGNILTRFAQF
jgi:hypothetical protein